jgi:hypothetical protein
MFTCGGFCGTISDDVRMKEKGQLDVAFNLLDISSLHQQVDGILERL